jgi:hypothetical protein
VYAGRGRQGKYFTLKRDSTTPPIFHLKELSADRRGPPEKFSGYQASFSDDAPVTCMIETFSSNDCSYGLIDELDMSAGFCFDVREVDFQSFQVVNCDREGNVLV